MSLWTVLVTGLLAGGASCAAVQGGLLAGAVARRHRPPPAPGRRGARGRHGAEAPPPRFGDDAVPVGGFLAGKLLSHTALGGLLGLLGDTVTIGVGARSSLQIVAGVVMVLLAADLLGLRSVRRLVPSPPAAWVRLVRRSARWSSAAAPALLGAATVLLPCAVTLSMEVLAVASGSPLGGAAIMATFVAGTSPLFAALGYAARRSTAALRGRLGLLTGVAVAVAGLASINSGLVLAGSPLTLGDGLRSLAGSGRPPASAPAPSGLPPSDADGVQHLVLQADEGGYSPSVLRARAGVQTELIVRTDARAGCTRALVIPSMGFERILGTGETPIRLGVLEAGTIRFTCAMGMYAGRIEAVS